MDHAAPCILITFAGVAGAMKNGEPLISGFTGHELPIICVDHLRTVAGLHDALVATFSIWPSAFMRCPC